MKGFEINQRVNLGSIRLGTLKRLQLKAAKEIDSKKIVLSKRSILDIV